jgi:CheY-like chemotaxis protein/anti-anti-sigma regulatory factor
MTLKVLTVDDSKTIRRIVSKAFKPYDCEIHEAENGVEGLTIASKIRPDLIVLDITMPIMNGIEMLKKMRQEILLKDIPVIMLTAESGKDSVVEIAKIGVKDYMVKPFKDFQLIERAEKIVKLKPKPEDPADTAAIDSLFSDVEGKVCLSFPRTLTRNLATDLENTLLTRIKTGGKNDQNKLIMDLSGVTDVNMGLIKLIVQLVGVCGGAGISVRIVGTQAVEKELKSFSEISHIPIHESRQAAAAAF